MPEVDHYFGSVSFDNHEDEWQDEVVKRDSWKKLLFSMRNLIPKRKNGEVFCAGIKYKDGTEKDLTLKAKVEINKHNFKSTDFSTNNGINRKIKDLIHNRLDIGQAKYGGEIQVDDSRDMVQETLEECLDGMVYISAKLIQLQMAALTNNQGEEE